MSTLPSAMPPVPGYDLFGTSRPAEQTGGDTFDMIPTERGLVVVLGDATGHGIAPALSVTQMQAMLRMAFRLGADLPTAFRNVNDQLARPAKCSHDIHEPRLPNGPRGGSLTVGAETARSGCPTDRRG